jgi:signal transduction histidine kinase
MQVQLRRMSQALKPYAQTFRLAASYLAILLIMSITFSAVLYHTSARDIGHQIPPDSFYETLPDTSLPQFHSYFRERLARSQHDLFTHLLILNLVVLLAGALVSFVLARRALEPIEDALNAQSRFAADASHELRTPLAAIQTENEVALRNPNLTLSRSKELLASNLEEVTRLQGLAEGLLRLSREEASDIKLEPVALAAVIEAAINHYQKAAEIKSIKLKPKAPAELRVLADARGAEQALGILLDNAIKYSPVKTSVTITAGRQNKSGFLRVRDEGPGIPADDLPHIFERFYRADQSRSSQAVSGHGLGLALADKLVNQLGGNITVTSKPGKGSTFTISLPLI